MIIDDFFRDEQNEVWVVCGDKKVHLTAEYIAAHKPQIGDEVVEEAEASVEAPVETPVEQ